MGVGLTRKLTDVDYLPFDVILDYIHAFLTLCINRHSGLFFRKARFVIDYNRKFEEHLFCA